MMKYISILYSFILKIKESQTFKNVYILMLGTAFAQVIPILTSPILTRLYTPDYFGQAAFYTSIVIILSIIATGRYEYAALVSKDDDEAAQIILLSFGLTTAVSFILFITICIFYSFMNLFVFLDNIKDWIYTIPFSVLIFGLYQSLNNWFIRMGEYRYITSNRIVQSIATFLVSLLFGISSIKLNGIILGQIIGQLIPLLILLSRFFRIFINKKLRLSFKRAIVLSKKYINFLKFSVLSGLLFSISNQLPVVFFNTYLGSAYAGYYSLTLRVLNTPISVLSSAITDVFRQKACITYREEGECQNLFKRTVFCLSIISILPFTLLFFFAPQLFSLVFGIQWRTSGVYAQILTIMFFFRFVISPVSFVITIAEKQKYDAYLQVLMLIFSLSAFLAGHFIFESEVVIIVLLSLLNSLCYILYFFISKSLSNGNKV